MIQRLSIHPGLAVRQDSDLAVQGATAIANGLKDPHCQLEALHLGDNGFGVEGAKGLAAGLWNCQALRELKLNNTSLGDEGMGLSHTSLYVTPASLLAEIPKRLTQDSS